MGWSGACVAFQNCVKMIYNPEDFNEAKRLTNDPEIMELKYSSSITIYLDDVHLISRTINQHFFSCNWVVYEQMTLSIPT